MRIDVLLFGQPRALAGTAQEVISVKKGTRLSDLIEVLGAKHGVAFSEEVRRTEGIRILINGREYDLLGGLAAPLNDKDTVVFLPLIFGG
jgi:molybdopterin converting factor small subunit